MPLHFKLVYLCFVLSSKFVFETNATTLSQLWSSNSFEVDL